MWLSLRDHLAAHFDDPRHELVDTDNRSNRGHYLHHLGNVVDFFIEDLVHVLHALLENPWMGAWVCCLLIVLQAPLSVVDKIVRPALAALEAAPSRKHFICLVWTVQPTARHYWCLSGQHLKDTKSTEYCYSQLFENNATFWCLIRVQYFWMADLTASTAVHLTRSS